MKLRVHIAPVGFEIDRIVVPAIKMRADKVWLIGHNNLSEDKARPFLEKIKNTLEKNNIDVETTTANRYRLFLSELAARDIKRSSIESPT